ncbi:MAG TPA: hypothetical protein VEB21_04345 [Terriglobales bacterium]|nr:hypothetical protein [Terriglobales bacterium]
MALASAVLLAGCATVSFKRGASPDVMSADERACRKQTSGEHDFRRCMRERGLYVTGSDGGSEAEARPSPVPTTSGAADGGFESPLPPVMATPGALAVAPADNVLMLVPVGSWWKFGATAEQVPAAIDACVAQLGESHRPARGAVQVTAGLRACMRQNGWFSVKAEPSR